MEKEGPGGGEGKGVKKLNFLAGEKYLYRSLSLLLFAFCISAKRKTFSDVPPLGDIK